MKRASRSLIENRSIQEQKLNKIGQSESGASSAIEANVLSGSVDKQIAQLCEIAWERVPELTKRLRSAGYGPGRWPSWDSLIDVPLLRKSSLAALQTAQPPLGGLAPEPYAKGQTLFMSPGGILEPNLPSAETRLVDLLVAAGIRPDDIILNGFSYHFTPAGLLFHGALNRLGATCLPGGPQNTELLIQYMQRTQATGFVGIGSHLKLLIQQAESAGLVIGSDLPLRIALVGAEPGAEASRAELRERYGIHCFDLYGTADVGLVAGDCSASDGLHVHPDVLVEIVDRETGERLPEGQLGELVITVNNPEYPMLRYATGDLCSVMTSPCSCGDSRPRISRIAGRADRSARVRGMLLYEHEIRQLLVSFPGVQQCSITLTREGDRDQVAGVLMVSDGVWTDEERDAFAQAFRQTCRLRLDSLRFTDDTAEFQSGLLRDHRSLTTVGQP